jgi:hypothetical protein
VWSGNSNARAPDQFGIQRRFLSVSFSAGKRLSSFFICSGVMSSRFALGLSLCSLFKALIPGAPGVFLGDTQVAPETICNQQVASSNLAAGSITYRDRKAQSRRRRGARAGRQEHHFEAARGAVSQRHKDWGAPVLPLHGDLVGDVRLSLLMLLGALRSCC